MDLIYKTCSPLAELFDYVECFWELKNTSNTDKKVDILPDGRVDIIFSFTSTDGFEVIIQGLAIAPDHVILKKATKMMAISFKLLGVEYLLEKSIANLVDKGQILPADFWGFNAKDLDDFQSFCAKATQKLTKKLPKEIDNRKQELFELIYQTNGNINIKTLSEKVFWSSRQINRYFNQQFGLSLKAYCTIVRFRSSFTQIKKGHLYANEEFVDQSHFIKEVKKKAGVSPKVLNKNQNNRYIQFTLLK